MEPSVAPLTIQTKSVFGLQCDPFNHTQFASYSDDTISIWDSRKTAEPVLNLQGGFQFGVSEIMWSNVNPGCLLVSGKDSAKMNLWDIKLGAQVLPDPVLEILSPELNSTPTMSQVGSLGSNSLPDTLESPKYYEMPVPYVSKSRICWF